MTESNYVSKHKPEVVRRLTNLYCGLRSPEISGLSTEDRYFLREGLPEKDPSRRQRVGHQSWLLRVAVILALLNSRWSEAVADRKQATCNQLEWKK